MTTPEGRLKNEVTKYLHGLPRMFFWCVQDRFTSGIMDIVGCYKGLFFGIELKAKGGRPTKLQSFRIRQVRDAGGKARVAYSLTQVHSLIKELDNAYTKHRKTMPRASKKGE